MKITKYLKSRMTYYISFILACLLLYLIIPNSTFMGVIIGLFVSEIQNIVDFQDKIKSLKQSNYNNSENLEELVFPDVKFNWYRLLLYVVIALVIWVISNIYLHFTIE